MKNPSIASLTLILLLCPIVSANGQDAKKDDTVQNCPMHKQHMTENSHQAAVDKHGDQAMGFSHETTTHHFRMASDGGAIEVTANDLNDKASMEAILSPLPYRDHVWKRRLLYSHVRARGHSAGRNDNENIEDENSL